MTTADEHKLALKVVDAVRAYHAACGEDAVELEREKALLALWVSLHDFDDVLMIESQLNERRARAGLDPVDFTGLRRGGS